MQTFKMLLKILLTSAVKIEKRFNVGNWRQIIPNAGKKTTTHTITTAWMSKEAKRMMALLFWRQNLTEFSSFWTYSSHGNEPRESSRTRLQEFGSGTPCHSYVLTRLIPFQIRRVTIISQQAILVSLEMTGISTNLGLLDPAETRTSPSHFCV